MIKQEQKIKELCHQNYIGSVKCYWCRGKGRHQNHTTYSGDCDNCGKQQYANISGNKCSEVEEVDCTICSGKGYTIPLEKGCEVELYGHDCPAGIDTDTITKVLKKGTDGIIWKRNGEYDEDSEIIVYGEHCDITEDISKNLGKPLDEKMLLRLLNKKVNEDGNLYMEFHTDGHLMIKGGVNLIIDLTKDLKDQEEVLQIIIDIVNG